MVRDQGRDPQGRGDSERGECVEGQMGGGSPEVISGTRESGAGLWGVRKGTVNGSPFALLSAPRPPPEPWGPGPPSRGSMRCRKVQGERGRATPQARQVFGIL